jgi:hypothetical protein
MARGDRFFFHPTGQVYDRPEEHGIRYDAVQFNSSDGTSLYAWFLHADLARAPGQPARPLGTLVHCHGNAGNITGHYRFVAWLIRRGWNVFCFDYRGYGKSQGTPTREGAVADAGAAIDWAGKRESTGRAPLVLFGQSIGGSIAIAAAINRTDLAAIAVEGAFASYQTEARYVCRRSILWGVAGLVSRTFVAAGCDPLDCVADLPAIPKLFMCGRRDPIVDCRETVQLYERAREPKEQWMLEGGSHTEALIDNTPDDLDPSFTRRDRFEAFLRAAVGGIMA